MMMKTLTLILKIVLLCLAVFSVLIVVLYGHWDIPVDGLKPKYAQEPSAFISMDGMDVHYRDEGPSSDSIPIVLIHGTGSSLHTFDDWVTTLKKDHRVLRMDLPGFGLTGPFPSRSYSIDKYVDFVDHFLAANGITRCILAGNSLGGNIAWSFAVQHPELVDRLILIDASGYPSEATSVPIAFRMARIPVLNKLLTFITPRFMARSSVENVYVDKSKVTEDLVDRYYELTLRTGNRQGLVDRIQMGWGSDSYQAIASIQIPTLVLWGAQDQLIPVSNAHRFHEDLPNDTLVILPYVGHVPMEEAPDESLSAVEGFLKSF